MPIDKRSHEVDVIRAAALIGICIVNIPFMAVPVDVLFSLDKVWYDKVGAFFVEAFFQLKFFLLFSFVFGWGMAIQAKSVESKGQSFARRYFRRLMGLAVFGVAHAVFVFSGDILLTYALLGLMLWLVKDRSPRALLQVAAWMLPLSMFFLAILGVSLGSVGVDDAWALALDGPSLGGGYFEATQARVAEWSATFVFLLFLQGPLAFGAFALGLAAAKADFFAVGSVGFRWLEKSVPLLLVVALPLNLLYAAAFGGFIPESYEILNLSGLVLIAVGAPALSAVYLYVFIQVARNLEVPKLLVLAGRNSLSTYILQGVLAGFVFGAYGLGYFNVFGAAFLVPLSLLIAVVAMLSIGWYASVFGRGPLEPVLRWMSGR